METPDDARTEPFRTEVIEQKWQQAWKDARLFEARREEGKEKFFLIFAYPGISGYLHVGHMRGYTYADVLCRYQRMQGKNVLFPAGFHASGLPAAGLAKRVARGDEKTLTYLRNNETPEDIIEKLGDANFVVEHFSNMYVTEYWEKFGFSIDPTRFMSTIDEGYNRFIQWQFRKLDERNLLVKKPHHAPFCPGCGPVAVDASETDVLQGGSADIMEFSMLKFQGEIDGEDVIFPAATLRPETVFGVTNMWLNPDTEYEVLTYSGKRWIMSPEAASKLRYQKDGVGETERVVKGVELLGRTLTVPRTGKKVPILPGRFVKPSVATGVVMSVPAHAPFDHVALQDFKRERDQWPQVGDVGELEAISLISSPEGDFPAITITERMGITRSDESEKLDEATEKVYSIEFHKGRLKDICGEYSGLSIAETKDTLAKDFLAQDIAETFMEFSERVVCRCGTDVVIKAIPDQWFIRYSDEELTRNTVEHTREMFIHPEEYKRDVGGILEWFQERACIRQGSWLGTRFPLNEDWIIEPISDSTLYPTFYIVSKYINDGRLPATDVTDALLDYVYLGRGDVDALPEVAQEIRDDFLYWYPLDINLGGKEHKTVHFPVFMMNHVAILEKEHWPRGVFVNWWVTMTGGDKMSKSKGGAEPIPEAVRIYGVDAIRLYYCHIGSSFIDIEWEATKVTAYRNHLSKIFRFVCDHASAEDDPGSQGAAGFLDTWLGVSLDRRFRLIRQALDSGALRDATNEAFYGVWNDIRWYIQRGGSTGLRPLLGRWVRAIAPFTPHLAEELHEKLGGEGFVTSALFPETEAEDTSGIITLEDEVRDVGTYIRDFLKRKEAVAEACIIHTAAPWKKTVLIEAVGMVANGQKLDFKALLDRAQEASGLEPKQLTPFLKSIMKKAPKSRDLVASMGDGGIDEAEYLMAAIEYLSKEAGVEVKVFSESDPSREDPQQRASVAFPGTPAITLVLKE